MGSEALSCSAPAKAWDGTSIAPLLQLRPLGNDRFTCDTFHTNQNGAIYGGQTLGLAVAAALATVDEPLRPHVLQHSFLAAGDVGAPLTVTVERVQQSRRFAARLVRLEQHQRTIALATVSFHAGESGMAHEISPPMHHGPEGLMNLTQLRSHYHDRLNAQEQAFIGKTQSVEIRPVQAEHMLLERDALGDMSYWMRSGSELTISARMQPAALAYLSDFWFGITALTPHHEHKLAADLFVASLNHTIWFHQPVDCQEWLLVSANTPAAGSGRGLSLGHIYDREGHLLASMAQEGLYRQR